MAHSKGLSPLSGQLLDFRVFREPGVNCKLSWKFSNKKDFIFYFDLPLIRHNKFNISSPLLQQDLQGDKKSFCIKTFSFNGNMRIINSFPTETANISLSVT